MTWIITGKCKINLRKNKLRGLLREPLYAVSVHMCVYVGVLKIDIVQSLFACYQKFKPLISGCVQINKLTEIASA